MPDPPTNIRDIATSLDGTFVKMAYDCDDPTVDDADVYESWSDVHAKNKAVIHPASKTFVVRGGWSGKLVTMAGSSKSTPVAFSAPAAEQPTPVLTQHEHLEAALGESFAVGDQVGGFTVTVDKTIHADGTIS